MLSTPKTKGFHKRSRYSNFKFECFGRRRHRRDNNIDIEGSEPDDGFLSHLLQKGSLSCHAILNDGQEDEMKVTGYRRSAIRTIICWICIVLTCGLLRLFMHWWRHWLLLATHSPCPLDIAEKVLVREDYKGKHTIYYAKDVITLNSDTYKKMKEDKQKWNNFFPIDDNSITVDNDFKISIHFSSGEWRHMDTVRLFRCKQVRYIWDAQIQAFRKLKGLDVNINSTYLHKRKGLTKSEHNARRLIYGANEIIIPVKGVFKLLFLEALNPFYCFQLFSVCLWISYNYYYYAVVIMCMSVFGVVMQIHQTRKNQQQLVDTLQKSDGAYLIYEGDDEAESVHTEQLVPGDLIQIPSTGCTMQCDAVLLSGNCILDESLLTGESVPVTKTPLPMKRDLMFDLKEHGRHVLFCGTKVIQTRYIGSEKVLAVVINTGYITVKGGLTRAMLYPPPVDYKFEQDSYKFIALLGLIAGIGFIYTLVTKIIRSVSAVKIAIESLDLITIAVPPALPAAMSVGRFSAQSRLKRKHIYCISPRSINVSGSVNCVCFDKTGTLTEDGLDMWGVVPRSETNQFLMPLKQIDRLPLGNFLYGMVSCHSLAIMENKLKGDPLDLKMFESTGWILEEANVAENKKYDLLFPTIVRQPKSNRNSVGSNNSSTTSNQLNGSDEDLVSNDSNDIGIVREFSFTSSLQRMSVITRKLSDNHFNVYCKGSPEMIQTLCRSSTIPENYSTQLDYYAQQGYRIIAVAYKPLDKKMTYAKVQKISRDKIECDLEFLGFVILENRLKPDTTEVIKNLTEANIRTIMVTGDNILTALSVAKQCGMVTPKQNIITVNTRQNIEQNGKYELYYNLTGTTSKPITQSLSTIQTPNGNGEIGNVVGDGIVGTNTSSIMTNSNSVASLETIATWTHRDIESGLPLDGDINSGSVGDCVGVDDGDDCIPQDFTSNLNNYRFAMVGKTWSIVQENFPELLPKFLTRGTIFARMSPENKQSLIIELQNLGYCVAMCGDGANDCGALKAAHTGISLSEAESSVASPFTSKNQTVACVPNVIREGRAALVTSFGIFKYMAAYSLVQFVSVLLLYSIDSNLTDIQFLYIDLGLISVFAFFFGKTEAYEGPLVKQTPLSSLISLSPILSIVFHISVAIIFQVCGWYHVKSQPWFKPFNLTDTGSDMDLAGYENYTIFIISCFQYTILAFVFSRGAPYRKSIVSNYMFLLAIVLNTCFIVYLAVIPPKFIADSFELIMPPSESKFRLYLVAYGITNFLVSLLIEEILIEYLLSNKLRYRFHNIEKSHHKYLRIENELRNNYEWPPLSSYQNDIKSIMNSNDEKQSPVSYAEIGAEHGVDIGQELLDQNNSVLNRFFDNHYNNQNHDIDDIKTTIDSQIINQNNNFNKKSLNSINLNDSQNSLNKKINKITKNATGQDTDDDDDDLSSIDSESDYESIQNDFKYNNGSQDNVLATTSSSSTQVTTNNPTTTTIAVINYQNNNNNNNNNLQKISNKLNNELLHGNNDIIDEQSINKQNQKISTTTETTTNNSGINGIEMIANPIKLSTSSLENNRLINNHSNQDDYQHYHNNQKLHNHYNNHHRNNDDNDLLLQQTTFNNSDTTTIQSDQLTNEIDFNHHHHHHHQNPSNSVKSSSLTVNTETNNIKLNAKPENDLVNEIKKINLNNYDNVVNDGANGKINNKSNNSTCSDYKKIELDDRPNYSS